MQLAKDSMTGSLITRCTIYRQFVRDHLITNTYEKGVNMITTQIDFTPPFRSPFHTSLSFFIKNIMWCKTCYENYYMAE